MSMRAHEAFLRSLLSPVACRKRAGCPGTAFTAHVYELSCDLKCLLSIEQGAYTAQATGGPSMLPKAMVSFLSLP